jgi:hypothetical protein
MALKVNRIFLMLGEMIFQTVEPLFSLSRSLADSGWRQFRVDRLASFWLAQDRNYLTAFIIRISL